MILNIKTMTFLLISAYAGCFGVSTAEVIRITMDDMLVLLSTEQPEDIKERRAIIEAELLLKIKDLEQERSLNAERSRLLQLPFALHPFGYNKIYTGSPLSICKRGISCLFCFSSDLDRRRMCNQASVKTNPKYKLFENYNLDESEQNSLQAFLAEIKEKVYQPVGVESSLKGEIYPGKFIINTAAEEYIFSVSDNGKAFNPILGMIKLNTEQPFSFVKDGSLYRVFSENGLLPSNLLDLLQNEDVSIGVVKTQFTPAKVVELITAVRNLQLSNLSDIHNWMSVIPFEIKRNLEEIYGYEKEKSASAFRYIIDQLENPNLKDYLANEKLNDPQELGKVINELIKPDLINDPITIKNLLSITGKTELDKSSLEEWIQCYLPLKITEDLALVSRFIYWLSVARENDLELNLVQRRPGFQVEGITSHLKDLTSILLDIINRTNRVNMQ